MYIHLLQWASAIVKSTFLQPLLLLQQIKGSDQEKSELNQHADHHTCTHLHAKGLVRCQRMQMVEIWFGEDDCILGGGAPRLHEVDCIATTEGRMAGEHHTRRLVHRPKVAMKIGKMFQTTAANELQNRTK